MELIGQFSVTAALLLTGKWFTGIIQLGVTCYCIHLYVKKQLYIDATDVFKNLKAIKQRRWIIFAAHSFTFLLITFR